MIRFLPPKGQAGSNLIGGGSWSPTRQRRMLFPSMEAFCKVDPSSLTKIKD